MPHALKTPLSIRSAKPSDAKALNLYQRKIFRPKNHLITKPNEFRMGTLKQWRWIHQKRSNPYETCLLAISNHEIVGALDNWTDRRRRVTHNTCFTMSVKEGWRGLGVGKRLLTHFIDWVSSHPTLERIELHVHSDNDGALVLYKNCGFEVEGTRRQAIRYEDGRIVDDYIMALWP